MTILIKGTDFSITSSIKDYIDNKIGSLKKYLQRLDGPAVEAQVEVGKITEHHHKGNIFRAEVNLVLSGKMLRAEVESDDVYKAIDLVHDELKGQIVSLKDKMLDTRRRASRRLAKEE